MDTVREGAEVATARQGSTLLLPTVIVPGYLNDLGGKPEAGIIATLEQRGYHATAASPDVFWLLVMVTARGTAVCPDPTHSDAATAPLRIICEESPPHG